MLKKSIQKQYLEQHWDNLSVQLDLFCDTGNAEALHQFRVETKKIRALLALQSFKNEAKSSFKEFQTIREIFKQAGKIREAQLHLAVMDNLGIKEAKIKAKLTESIEFKSAKFELKKRWYVQQLDAAFGGIKDTLVPMDDEHVEAFFNKTIRSLCQNCHRVYYLSTLHESRKSIKVIQHLREFFSDFQLNWDYIDQLQTKIGAWHDLHRTYLFIYNNGASDKNCTLIRNAQQEKVQEIKTLIKVFDTEVKLLAPAEMD